MKPVCPSFMSSSAPHKIAAREEVVPVPFRHTDDDASDEQPALVDSDSDAS